MNNDHAQTANCAKTNLPEAALPSVTVVTVVYNDAQNIEKTLQSIIDQQYPRLEYIVIDGGSTDGTVDIIKKHEQHITHWISEKDRGIYDAMNKGIDLATGDWINFMNSNDLFYNATTIYDVFQDCPKDVDFIYGYVVMKDNGKDRPIDLHRPMDKLWKGMPFCHQALFSKTQLLKKNKFCLTNKIISDYKSVFLHYMDGKRFFNCNKTIAIVSEGGVSDNIVLKVFERWRFVRKHKKVTADVYYFCIMCMFLVLSCFPMRIRNRLVLKISALSAPKKPQISQ